MNQTDRFILVVWRSARRIRKMRILGESKSGPTQNWGIENKFFKKLVLKVCGKCKNCQRFALLKLRELSGRRWMNFHLQEFQESQSTANQLTVQNQELQDKVNSLNDSKDFHDLETASSSGLSRVPCHPLTVLSPFLECYAAILARSLIHGTYLVHRETFLKMPPAADEPTGSCSRNVYARSLTATISAEIITVLTRYRPIVLELI